MALLPAVDADGQAGDPEMGPEAFTAIRLLSGAAVLAPLLLRRKGAAGAEGAGESRAAVAMQPGGRSPWLAALALAAYAITFSASYVTIPAGIGALLLFGTVQILMLGVALVRGERLGALQVLGFLAAIAGVVVLVRPSASDADAVDMVGALLMMGAGVGWGSYTLLGRGATDPALQTARNFVWCVPFALAVGVYAMTAGAMATRPSSVGVGLAVVSGAVTSGAGYVLWYAALRGHTRTSAAAVQLLVPILAALGGVVLLEEALTSRFVLASALVLGGVGAAVGGARSGSSGAAR